MDLAQTLLSLAASATWDGGEEVLRTLRAVLLEAAPFDLGEVAVSRTVGFERWTLTDDEEPLASDDLLLHVIAQAAPLRLDDVPEAGSYPRTRDIMLERGVRSLLAIPLSAAGGAAGAVVLARRQGWGFVGASLHLLWPAVGMAGLAFERARALTALRKEMEGLVEKTRTHLSELEILRGERDGLVVQRDGALAEAARLRDELEALRSAPPATTLRRRGGQGMS